MEASQARTRTTFTPHLRPTPAQLRTEWMPQRARESRALLFGYRRVEVLRLETAATPVAPLEWTAARQRVPQGTPAAGEQTRTHLPTMRMPAAAAAGTAARAGLGESSGKAS